MEDSKLERQREHFNKIADLYERGQSEPTHKRIKELIWAKATQSMDPPNKARPRVLEPMCGFAEGKQILDQHLSSDFIYSGFDYSDRVIEKLKEARPDLNVWHGDVTTYEPENAAYDIIILIGGLHHVPDQAAETVKRLSKGLVPDGLFISLEPTSGNPVFEFIRTQIYKKNAIFDQQTERGFRVAELKRMFLSAGLKQHYCSYPGLLAYVFYYNPYAFPFLNVGGTRIVDALFALDRLFYRNVIGRIFSFATLSIWRRL